MHVIIAISYFPRKYPQTAAQTAGKKILDKRHRTKSKSLKNGRILTFGFRIHNSDGGAVPHG